MTSPDGVWCSSFEPPLDGWYESLVAFEVRIVLLCNYDTPSATLVLPFFFLFFHVLLSVFFLPHKFGGLVVETSVALEPPPGQDE